MKCRGCPYQSAFYRSLTDAQLDLIDQHRCEMTYQPGDVIVKQGNVCTHVYSFVQGLAKVHISIADDKDLIIRLIKGGEFIAGSSLETSSRQIYSVTAVEETKVCLIDVSVIDQLTKENNSFAHDLLRHFYKSLAFTTDRLTSIYTKRHLGRLADVLIYLSEQVYHDTTFHLSLSKYELADFAGISRENLYRLLKSLEDDKILKLHNHTVEILHPDKLKLFSLKG